MNRCNYCPRYEINKKQNAECKTCDFFSIIVPQGATNGDVIKVMFPNGKYGTNGDFVHVYITFGRIIQTMTFDLSWWNAPYKAESEV